MIDWQNDFGVYHTDFLPTDWQHVVSLDSGGGYDWATLEAFWSPTERRFFWNGDSGCSCNSWGDGLYRQADFQTGDRDALARALRAFADEHSYDFRATDLVDALETVHRFTPGEVAS